MRRAALLMLLALAQAKLRFSGRRALEGLNGAHGENRNNLVDSLRRQLMHDNYDYMTSASADLLEPAPPPYDDMAALDAGPPVDDGDYFPEPSPARSRGKRPRAHALEPRAQSLRRQPPRGQLPRGQSFRAQSLREQSPGEKSLREQAPRGQSRRIRPRAQVSVEAEPQAPAQDFHYQHVESNVPVSNKDLYYYVDDARLNGGARDALAFNVLDVADAPDNDDFDDEAPEGPQRKKKYTILEIEGEGGTRRKGGPARRRFVQEEGDDGIAIVSLDNGPFPEFRLPTDRRQYMHHEYDDPHLAPNAPSPQHRHAPPPRLTLQHSQQEDDLLYLS